MSLPPSYLSDLGVDACRAAIRDAAQEQTFWLDSTFAETPVFRDRRGALDIRFKRAMARVAIHNWFTLTFSDAGSGRTTIAVTKRLGVGRAWWIPGLFACLVALVTTGRFMSLAMLLCTAFMQVITFLVSIIVAATATSGDWGRLSSFLVRVARVRGANSPLESVSR